LSGKRAIFSINRTAFLSYKRPAEEEMTVALKLQTIIVSTRPGRKGPPVARWFHDYATANSPFDAELVDLADFDLPVFDEPEHPRFRKYVHEHTRKWSESVEGADAFVFVTPEYNFGPPPSFLNAVTYLSQEWAYKPAGFVSYGGVSGGLRGVQMEKLTLTTLKVVPVPEAVSVQFFAQLIENGVFKPTDLMVDGAKNLLSELHRWATALKGLRSGA
jgi:NAD(P)H-dependent FMN reductase